MMSFLRTLFVLLSMACCAGAAAQTPARSEPVPADRIVAVVNEEVITLQELRARLSAAVAQLRRQETPLPPADVLEKQMLDRLVMEKVQLQHAKDIGIRVDDAQLDQAIQRIAASNNLTMAQFRQVLEKDGLQFPKFREEIRNEITIVRVREREVDNKIVISEGEIDNYLQGEAGSAGAQEEFEVSMTLTLAGMNSISVRIFSLPMDVRSVPQRLQTRSSSGRVMRRSSCGNFARSSAVWSFCFLRR